MENNVKRNMFIENATISCRNFSGRVDEYNTKGERNFLLNLTDEQAEEMIERGWNVKQWPARDGEEKGGYFIRVALRFDPYPPSVFLLNGKKKIRLTEETIDQLDWTEIETLDIMLTSYRWTHMNRSGIKVVVKSMMVTPIMDEMAAKYAYLDYPEEDATDSDAPF